MRCPKAQEMVSPWLDGLLAAAAERELLRHLEACASCAREAVQLREILRVMRSRPEAAEPPPGLAAAVLSRLAEPARPAFGRPFQALALAASLLFMFSLSGPVWRNYPLLRGGLPEPEAAGPAVLLPVLPPADAEPETAGPAVPLPVLPPADAEPETAGPAVTLPLAPAPPSGQPEGPAAVAPAVLGAVPPPQLFLRQARRTETITLRVAVPCILSAAETLAAEAARQGLEPELVTGYTILGGDGRLIRIYRYAVPQVLANRFFAGTATLGRLVGEERQTRDISAEYDRKLDQYLQLAAQAGSRYPGDALSVLLGELTEMHQSAQGMKSFTVWLES